MNFEATKPDPPSEDTSTPPPHERDAELDNVRYNDTFITLKMDFATADDFATNLYEKYKVFLNTLQIVDESLIILSANPSIRRDPIFQPEEIPTTVTGMIPYFHTTSRPAKDKAFFIWSTARISHDADWEDIIETSRYGLTDDGIVMMYKRIQTFKTKMPGYLQFVDNNADPQDLCAQVCDDIGDQFTVTIHNREPFENNYAAMQANKKKKKDFFANAPHFECADGEEEDLKDNLRSWIKSGQASRRFGLHIKFIEALTKTSSPRQVDRTIRMNSHGRRFQASIEMAELHGLLNPNGIVTIDGRDHTV